MSFIYLEVFLVVQNLEVKKNKKKKSENENYAKMIIRLKRRDTARHYP